MFELKFFESSLKNLEVQERAQGKAMPWWNFMSASLQHNQTTGDFDAIMASGIKAHSTGDLENATKSYFIVLAANPDHVYANLLIGILLFDKKKYQLASSHFSRAIKCKPDLAEAFNYRAVAFKELNRVGDAINDYSRAIALDPSLHEAHFNLGVLWAEQKRFGDAIRAFRASLLLRPEDQDTLYNIAKTLSNMRQYSLAIPEYTKLLELNPCHELALINRSNAYAKLNDHSNALAGYRRVISLNPKIPEVLHLINALSGIATKKPPLGYVENLFDNYAATFERTLVDELGYQIPSLVGSIIRQDYVVNNTISVLDLGCGTGLMGEAISDLDALIVGVDLSQKMLKEASTAKRYQKLFHCDIQKYLSSQVLDFDYFIANDVFIYVGDLEDIFSLVKKRNKRGGRFIFTVELNDTDRFILEQSGRYSHSRSYLQKIFDRLEMQELHYENVRLRKEFNSFVIGGLFVLKV